MHLAIVKSFVQIIVVYGWLNCHLINAELPTRLVKEATLINISLSDAMV